MKTKLLGVVAGSVLALNVGAASADTFNINGIFSNSLVTTYPVLSGGYWELFRGHLTGGRRLAVGNSDYRQRSAHERQPYGASKQPVVCGDPSGLFCARFWQQCTTLFRYPF